MNGDIGFWPQTQLGQIARLANTDDQEAWTAFQARYRAPVVAVARRAGLSADEAVEVLQSTLIAVRESLASYDPTRSKFRTWLGGVVRHRIQEQVRRRPKGAPLNWPLTDTTTCTAVPVSTTLVVEPFPAFEEEDERWLDRVAWERLKKQVSTRQWQVLYELVGRGRSPNEVARMFGMQRGAVYVIKLRHLQKLKILRRQVEVEDEQGSFGGPGRTAIAKPPSSRRPGSGV